MNKPSASTSPDAKALDLEPLPVLKASAPGRAKGHALGAATVLGDGDHTAPPIGDLNWDQGYCGHHVWAHFATTQCRNGL